MGAWGFNFLESDYDYDIAGELADEAGVDCLMFPVDRSSLRDQLNDGLLKQMFDSRQKMRPQPKYEIVMLAVLAMKLGCAIEDSHIRLLKRVYRHCDMGEGKMAAMKPALRKYKAGEEWDFGDKNLIETAFQEVPARDDSQEEDAKEGTSTGKNKRTRKAVNPDANEHGDMEATRQAKKLRYDDEGAGPKAAKLSYSEKNTGDIDQIMQEPKDLRAHNSSGLLEDHIGSYGTQSADRPASYYP